MWTSRSKIENSWVSFVQLFHCSYKNKIHMHEWATKYKLYNFSDFCTNALIFALKTTLYNIKVNGTIYVNNLNFKLLVLKVFFNFIFHYLRLRGSCLFYTYKFLKFPAVPIFFHSFLKSGQFLSLLYSFFHWYLSEHTTNNG